MPGMPRANPPPCRNSARSDLLELQALDSRRRAREPVLISSHSTQCLSAHAYSAILRGSVVGADRSTRGAMTKQNEELRRTIKAGRARAAEYHELIRCAQKTQSNLVRKLISDNTCTAFGSEHAFRNIRS